MKKNIKRNLNVFLAGSLTVGIAAPAVPSNVIAATIANDLIISEYIEGSSFNKALEIYNGTGAPIDLSSYTVELYSNGSTTPSQTVQLSGIIENGTTYVIYHGSAVDGIKSKGNLENSAVINFNGDDAIVLKNGDTIIDSFGQVGVDPGTSWGTDISSVNKTLVRKSSITAGDQNPNDAFDPAVQWSAYDIDTFAYLGSHVMGEETPSPNPIESTIMDVRNLPLGSSVSTTGIVTAVLGGTTFIQDETSGIVLYGFDLNVEPGDKVHVSGTLAEFRSLLQINVKAQNVEVLEKTTVPAPEVIGVSQLQESYEGKLLTIQNVTIESLSNGNYIAKDAEGTSFELRPSDTSLLSIGTTYESISGVLGSYNDVYQLIPRDANDVIEDSTIVRPVVAFPGEGLIEEVTKVTLATGTEGATIYYTTDGSTPTKTSEIYHEPITITEVTTIKAIAVKEGFTTSDVAEFNYIIQLDDIRIHDIQGEGHYSKYDGQNVIGVEGIVTHVNGNEFYMQDLQPDDNVKTSEGILVYKRSHGVEVGDIVTVSGEVREWVLEGYAEKRETDLPVTEINATEIVEIASNQELPEPIVIGKDRIPPTEIIDNDNMTEFEPEEDGIDFFESLEGMLVQVDNPKVVNVKNMTVKEDVIVTGKVSNDFSAEGLITNGELIIEESNSSVASMNIMASAIETESKVNLTNSQVNAINAKRNNVAITANTKLSQVKVGSNVASIKMNAEVEAVTVNTTGNLQVTGTGSIDKVMVENATQLTLDVAGQVKELNVANSTSKVTLGNQATVEKLVIPTGSDVSKLIENYDTVKENIADVVDEAGTEIAPNYINVTTLTELKEALANEQYTSINLKGNIENVSERIIVDRAITINGNGHSIKFTDEINKLAYGSRHGMLVTADDVKINNLTVALTEAANWQGAYGVQVYDAQNVVLNNFTGTNADAAILVNGSTVELTGKIVVSGNEFGGIEVSKGSGLTNEAKLKVTGTIENTTEQHGEPTIWVVNGQGSIEGNIPTTVNTTIKADQTQYYVSQAAEATMNVNSINELKAALANTAIKTINLKENLSNISERIIVDREVEINGNGHAISFTNEINELAYGSRHGILILSDNVKINDITVTLTEAANWQGAYAVQVYDAKNVVLKNFTGSAADAALLVNASDVELTGTTTVSGNEFGGIEVSKGSLAGLENSLLTVTGSLANTTEETGKPTIWVVKDQGIVAGVNVPTTVDTEIKADQIQYYLSK